MINDRNKSSGKNKRAPWGKRKFGDRELVGGKKVGLNWCEIMALKQSFFSQSY